MRSLFRRSLTFFVSFSVAIASVVLPAGTGVAPAFGAASVSISPRNVVTAGSANGSTIQLNYVRDSGSSSGNVYFWGAGIGYVNKVTDISTSINLVANSYVQCGSNSKVWFMTNFSYTGRCAVGVNGSNGTDVYLMDVHSSVSQITMEIRTGAILFNSQGPYQISVDDQTIGRYFKYSSSLVAFGTTPPAQQPTLSVTSLSGTAGEYMQLQASGGAGSGAIYFDSVPGGTATGCQLSPPNYLYAATAGTCYVMASKAGDSSANYDPAYSAATAVTFVAKQTQNPLVVAENSGTFGSTVTLSTTGGSGTGTLSYSVVSGNCSVTAQGVLSATSAGNCVVRATKAGDSTYSPVTSAQTTITFARASRTLTFATTAYSIAYGNSDTVIATPSAGSGDGAVTYSAGSSTACTVNSSSGLVRATQATGRCEITATVAQGTNYLTASTTVPVVVTTSTRAMTLTASGATVSFGTTYQTNPLTNDLVGAETIGSATYIYTGTGSTTYGPSVTKPVNAGTYLVTPSAAVISGGDSANYNITYVAGSIQISKVSRTLSFGASTSATLAFGSTRAVAATASAGDGAITYSAGASNGCSVNASTGVVTATDSTGTCVISATIAEGTNHLTASTTTSFTVTLAKRVITLKANNLTVEVGTTPTPTHSVTVGEVVPEDAILGVTYNYAGSGATVYTSSVTRPTTAGTYTITPSAAVFLMGDLSDYLITYSPGTLTITKRAITISVGDLNIVQGATVSPTFTVRAGTLLTGDEISGVTFTYAGLGTTVYQSSTVVPVIIGSYSVTASDPVFASGMVTDYELTFVSGTLSITARPSASGPTPAAPSSEVTEVSLTPAQSGQGSLLKVRLSKVPQSSEQIFVVVRLLDFKGFLLQELRIPISVSAEVIEVPVDKKMGQFEVVAFTSNSVGTTAVRSLGPQVLKQTTVIAATPKKSAALLGKPLGKAVVFYADSSNLTAHAKKQLLQTVKLAKASGKRIAVTGFHALSSKGSKFEKLISDKRALTVAKFLRDQGAGSWIFYHGLTGTQGKTFPGQPRRVEIRLLG